MNGFNKKALFLFFLICFSSTLSFSGDLTYTDNLDQFRVNWLRPSFAVATSTVPIDLITPVFTGDTQLYGKIPFGDSTDPGFYFAADLFGQRENLYKIKFYFDRNKNNDLTDDGEPLEFIPLTGGKIASFNVPYSNGQIRPYSFSVYAYFNNNAYFVRYYRDCAWSGELIFSSKPKKVVLLDDTNDAIYNQSNDYSFLDLNEDGIPDGSSDSKESIKMFLPFLVEDSGFSLDSVSVDGSSVSFCSIPIGTLSGIATKSSTDTVLSGVTIQVWSGINADGFSTYGFTDYNGIYSMDLPEGTYTVRVSKFGYIPSDYKISIVGNQTTSFDMVLTHINYPKAGTVVLSDTDWSYDFAKDKFFADLSSIDMGDFSFYIHSLKFYANYSFQRGLIDLGNIGNIPLDEVVIPIDQNYNKTEVDVILGHTYISLPREGEEGFFIVFRVTSVSADNVTLDYYFTPKRNGGDINADRMISLADAILGLQTLVGLDDFPVNLSADVNSDERIGMEEVVYILQVIVGFRQTKWN